MRMKTTRWRLDTCSCIVEYQWDRDATPATRSHTFSAIIKTGPEHGGLAGEILYLEVSSENRRKNVCLGIAQGLDASISAEDYEWSFDASRVLRVFFRGASVATRQEIQDACDIQFGPTKVAVVANGRSV